MADQISEKRCSYCLQESPEFLVKCMEEKCQKWFCNGDGNSLSSGGRNECHILTHLRISYHRQIAVLKNFNRSEASRTTQKTVDTIRPTTSANIGLKDQLFIFRCEVCKEGDSFDMIMETIRDGRNPEKHFCRRHAIESKIISTGKIWIPFVNCHYPPSFKCFNNSIIKVPDNEDQVSCRQISRQDIVALERSWLSSEVGSLASDEKAAIEIIRKEKFSTIAEYKDHFSNLVKLESFIEEAECVAIPILPNIHVKNVDQRKTIKWLEFQTDSPLHKRALQKGRQVAVNVERNNFILSLTAYIETNCEIGGVTVIRVRFRDRQSVKRQDLNGNIGIEVIFDSVVYKRWLGALDRFAGKLDAVKDERIKGFIIGHPIKKRRKRTSPVKDTEQLDLAELRAQNLNESQTEAVRMALTSPLSLIQGPPGTGKTHTIVAIVSNILKRNRNAKILCCAPSNDPTDHLAVQLASAGFRVTRINSKRIETEDIPENVLSLTLRYKLEQIFETPDYEHKFKSHDINQEINEIIKESQVICTTCNTAADPELADKRFANVIIDEATQASEPDALIPITKGCEKLVLIGDQEQLGVLVVGRLQELERSNRCWSLFERLIELGQAPRVMLDTQYRMHPLICGPASTVIYEGRLKTGLEVADLRQSDKLNFLHSSPIFLIDTNKMHEEASDGVSLLNPYEAIVVTLCLANLIHRDISPDDIGVITFYNGQKELLKKIIASHECIEHSVRPKLMIDSVDAFQGREKDYIILSCVRSGNLKTTTVGFLADVRRLNVALTRAKKGVIIVGNRSLLEKAMCWKKFLDFYPTVSEKVALSALGVPNDNSGKDCTFCINPFQRARPKAANEHRIGANQTLRHLRLESPSSIVSDSNYVLVNQTDPWIEVIRSRRARRLKKLVGSNAAATVTISSDQEMEEILENYASASNSSDTADNPSRWMDGDEHTGPSVLIEEAASWTEKMLYQSLKEFALSREELEKHGYPILYMDNKDSNPSFNGLKLHKAKSRIIDGNKMTKNERKCDRCQTDYEVDAEGYPLIDEQCKYHWGKRNLQGRQQKNSSNQTYTYKCCNGSDGSRTCTEAPGHVSRTYATMFNFATTHASKAKKPKGGNIQDDEDNSAAWSVLALDCEMLYTAGGYELGRVTLVNSKLEKVYDYFVEPKTRVIDYNTRFSGLTASDFDRTSNKVKTLAEVHEDLVGPIIHEKTVLIGHSLEEDLLCLKIIHNLVIDTSVVFRSSGLKGNTPALRTLVKSELNRVIQDGSNGHDSFEDAVACMELMLWKLGRDQSLLEM